MPVRVVDKFRDLLLTLFAVTFVWVASSVGGVDADSPVERPRQRRRRALVKTACYRLVMVSITVAVAWVVVGDPRSALDIGIIVNVLKTGTYYGYERLWSRIGRGMKPGAG